MSINEELNHILNESGRFLRQQRELYGDTLYPVQQESLTADGSLKRDSAHPVQPAPETDLFGSAPAPAHAQQKIGEQLLPAFPDESWTKTKTLEELNNAIHTCMKCGLGKTRIKFVFGVGNPKAEVVVVGEAPGADEDEKGEPFVGRAGQLLNKILEAVQFKREDVFICNILKCRPPNNRDPQTDEIDCCEPYLWKQLEILKPKMILCAGRIAGQSLLKTNASLTLLRGKVHDYRGIPLMVTYHPAALLRNPNWKRPCWEDMQQFRKLYDEMKNSAK
ncbi:MAG: uracil-DNA glycosylase [Ignavibacteriae bacterium]|nr:MAG: uracil-DNA glycosylase [Ignavibacteriota bacterium]